MSPELLTQVLLWAFILAVSLWAVYDFWKHQRGKDAK